MEIGFLNNHQFNFIENSLYNNKGMTEIEYLKLKKNHPYAVMRDDNALILSSMKHYGLHDTRLNEFLLKTFGNPNFKIDFFYELIYNEGDYTTPHLDKKTVLQTTLVLLEDNFTGGDLIIDDKNVNFNKKGMFINFKGYKEKHSVTKVESGIRRVLVIMFNKKQSLL